jgi:phosphopantetheinyl transferase
MKSAYELAMERLNKTAPTVKLSETQKQQMAELDSQYAAKIAVREIALKEEITKWTGAGEEEKAEEARQNLIAERKKLQSDLADKKERIRAGGKK